MEKIVIKFDSSLCVVLGEWIKGLLLGRSVRNPSQGFRAIHILGSGWLLWEWINMRCNNDGDTWKWKRRQWTGHLHIVLVAHLESIWYGVSRTRSDASGDNKVCDIATARALYITTILLLLLLWTSRSQTDNCRIGQWHNARSPLVVFMLLRLLGIFARMRMHKQNKLYNGW